MQTEAVAPSTSSQSFVPVEKHTLPRKASGAIARYRLEVLLWALVASGGMIAWLLAHRAEGLAYGPFAAKAAIILPVLFPGLSIG